MSMKSFEKKWNYVAVEDDGCYMSKQAKGFVAAFRNMLKSELDDGYNVSIKAGHYSLSGFVEKNGKYEYISYSIPRYGMRIDMSLNGALTGVLYRAAASDRDFSGGYNNFCRIFDLPQRLREHFALRERAGDQMVGLSA